MEDGRIIDEPDVIQGGVLMRKGAEEEPTLEAIHKKVDELNNGILPPGREGSSHAGPQRSAALHPAHRDA